MKIAIITGFEFHFECIPFLLESFKKDKISIYLDLKKKEPFNWIEFCQKLYKDINLELFYKIDKKKILTNYDKIFKLTSNDNCLNDKKIISIIHAPNSKSSSKKNISLSPYISGKNIEYLFPTFKPVIQKREDKTVTLIGYYLNSYFDNDTISFIKKNKNYKFNFIIWGDEKGYPNLTSLKNVKIYKRIKTNEMVEIINSSKYILSKKYINFDRFSGQLSLAVSFEKPLLIDQKTKETYKLPGVIFKKSYMELGDLDAIDESKYYIEVENIKNFKELNINRNKEMLRKL